MQDREEAKKLFKRYSEGKCSAEEKQKLHAWLNAYAQGEASGLDELAGSFQKGGKPVRRSSRRLWPAVAAAVIIILATGTHFWLKSQKFKQHDQLTEIVPGGNKAVLTLADGKSISLSEDQSGILVGRGRIAYDSGTDVINLSSGKGIAENTELQLSTPKGGTYQITLSDGTKVWLNAGSTLRYPLEFSSHERSVSIYGEAYFEIQKVLDPVTSERVPFVIESKGQEIQVLGTEFNVSAYDDDPSIRTTLVEGKIRLTDQKNTLLLQPGEQASYSGKGFTKRQVNVEQYTAWKNGEFHFDNTPLTEMLKQVARWFDIEIIYVGNPPAEVFSGVMSRNVSLQTLLELLRISEVKFRIENKTLIIG